MKAGVANSALLLVFNLLMVPFTLARTGESLYGAWIVIMTVVTLSALADGGVRTEVARRVAQAHGDGDPRRTQAALHDGTTAIALLAGPIVVALIIVAPVITQLALPSKVGGYSHADLTLALRVLLGALGAQMVMGAHLSALRGLQRQDVEFRGQLCGIPANAVMLVLGLTHGWGLWALLAGQIAAISVALAVQWRGLRRLAPDLRFRLARPRRHLIAFSGMSGLALVSQISDVFDIQWDKLVLSTVVGPAAVASFHVGITLALQAKVLAAVALAPLMVAVAEGRAGQLDQTRALQHRLMRLAAVLSSVSLGGLFLFAPPFVDLWLGTSYGETGEVARWSAVAVAINLAIAPAALQAFAEGHHRLSALGALSNIVANATLSLLLTLNLGLMGAVYGSIAGNTVGAVVFYVLARHRLAYWVSPPMASLALCSLVVFVAIAAGDYTPTGWPSFAACAVLFAVTVGAGGAWLEGLRWRDLKTRSVTDGNE